MAERQSPRKEYYIPDNFIEEGRVFQGRLRIRNLIEGIILAAIFSIPGLIIIGNAGLSLQATITILMFFCVPPAIAGIAGFNGDSLFSVLKSARKWRKNNRTMLYNKSPKLLIDDPVSAMLSETRTVDLLLDRYEESIRQRVDRKANLNMVEGRDFFFAEDDLMDKYTDTINTKSEEIHVSFSDTEALSSEVKLF